MTAFSAPRVGLLAGALAGLSLLCSCEALTNAALRVGSNLLASAASNYNPSYGGEVKALLQSLRQEFQPGKEASVSTAPASSTPPDVAPTAPTAAPPTGPDAQTGLSLDIALLRQVEVDGEIQAMAIEDGEVLVDADANGQSDRFKILIRAPQDCFVYVILVDGTGWVQPLFPGEASTAANPMLSGQELHLPEGELAFALDSYKGVETLYFVASTEPRPELEAAMQRFAQKQRRPPAQATEVASPEVLERGLARRRQGPKLRLRTRAGVQPVATTRFLSELGKDSLVVTRWFRHQ